MKNFQTHRKTERAVKKILTQPQPRLYFLVFVLPDLLTYFNFWSILKDIVDLSIIPPYITSTCLSLTKVFNTVFLLKSIYTKYILNVPFNEFWQVHIYSSKPIP